MSSSPGSPVEYTLICTYVCWCTAQNRSTLYVVASNTEGAIRKAKTLPLTCSSCHTTSVREHLKAEVQFLSF